MRITMKRILINIVITTCIFTIVGKAQLAEDGLRLSQNRPAIGALSLGLGGVAYGNANDFTALFTNPAGLAQIREYEFSIGLSRNGYSGDVRFWQGKETITNNKFNLENLGIVYPVPTRRGSLTFAFGIGRVQQYNTASSFGGFNIQNSFVEVITPTNDLWAMTPSERKDFLDNDISYQLWLSDTANGYLWPILTDSLQQQTRIIEEGGLNHWSLGMAIDIAPNLSFGVSLNIATGRYSYERVYEESDIFNVYRYAFPWNIDKFIFTQTISDDISGFNAIFGLMYREHKRFRVGVIFKTPTWYNISEGYGTRYESQFDNGYNYWHSETQSIEYSVTTPMVIGGGFSIYPFKWLILAGDIEYVDWSQIELSASNNELDRRLKEQTRRAQFELFRETINLRGGAELSLLDDDLKVRAGVAVYPSPYYADRNTTKYDRTYYTLGLSYRTSGNVTLSVGYAVGDYRFDRSTRDLFSRAGATSTSELITTQTISFMLSYRF